MKHNSCLTGSGRATEKGTRVKLIHMGNDPMPVPDGTLGTVEHIDDIGTIHVRWDNGRTLGLIPGEDQYEYI